MIIDIDKKKLDAILVDDNTWVGSPEETDRFVELSKLYLQGDRDVVRADDPEHLAFGLLRFLPDNQCKMAKVKLSEFKNLGTRIDMIAWDRRQVEESRKGMSDGYES